MSPERFFSPVEDNAFCGARSNSSDRHGLDALLRAVGRIEDLQNSVLLSSSCISLLFARIFSMKYGLKTDISKKLFGKTVFTDAEHSGVFIKISE